LEKNILHLPSQRSRSKKKKNEKEEKVYARQRDRSRRGFISALREIQYHVLYVFLSFSFFFFAVCVFFACTKNFSFFCCCRGVEFTKFSHHHTQRKRASKFAKNKHKARFSSHNTHFIKNGQRERGRNRGRGTKDALSSIILERLHRI